jgi:PAS domain S-box-containing protein
MGTDTSSQESSELRLKTPAAGRPSENFLERVSDAILGLDRQWHCTYANCSAGQLFGQSPQGLLGKHIWTEFPQGIGQPLQRACESSLSEQRFIQIESYFEPRWYENRIFPSRNGLSIFFHDITDQKLEELAAQETSELLQAQNRVLAFIAQGEPLQRTLDSLLRIVEEHNPGMLTSIVLLDPDGVHLRHAAAPSLPESFTKTIDGVSIGPGVGSCGTAAYRGKPVIVEDIATDPLWAGFRHLPLEQGLRACWSTPIKSEDNKVLGTFALYFRSPGPPDKRHLKQIEMVTYTASIAIAKQREREALLNAEQRLRLATEAGNIGLWERDIRTNQLLWSAQTQQIFGFPLEENPTYREYLKAVHPDDYARVASTVAQAIVQKTEFDAECRVLWRDGSVHWIGARGRAEYDANGQPLFLRGISFDITRRKQMEEKLRLHETQLADAHRVAHIGCYEWIPAIDTVNWTEELYRIFGFQPGEVQPTLEAYLERIHPDDRESTQKRIEQCMREDIPFEAEERFVRPDGSVRFLLSQGRCFFDENRQARKLVGTCHDITASREAERARIRLEEELRQSHKMESVGRLAGGVAHDFNNLLTVIFGHVALYRQELPPASPVHRHIQQIEQAAQRAATLTRHLLAFSRRQVIHPTLLDLNAIVNNLNKMMMRVLGEHISLRIVPGKSLGSIRADLGQIDQILMNLLMNGVDAMPKGGHIFIETANTELKAVHPGEINAHPSLHPGRYVMLSVTDTGCGMDEETMSQIFEPFFTTKAPGEGTGLGLSMVYGAVEQNHGHITVSSKPGKGTTFTVYFPRVDQAPDEMESLPAQGFGRRGSETILLVEDDEDLRALTTEMLTDHGYKILPAKNGIAALAIARQDSQKIDLLLTDVVMPCMNGPDLAARIQTHRPDLKVLYMSGYEGKLLSHHGVLEAETALLPKPFTKRDLLDRVNALLQVAA